MRSLRRLLGLEDSAPAADADTETVRRIAHELDAMDPEEARYLAAFAYVLARVAHADHDVSDDEVGEMERRVGALGQLSGAQAALVVQIAKQQAITLAGTENYVVTRQFRKLSTREQRLALLSCLFAVAAADDSVSEVENREIGQIASELGLTRTELVATRGAYRSKLAVLRDYPSG